MPLSLFNFAYQGTFPLGGESWGDGCKPVLHTDCHQNRKKSSTLCPPDPRAYYSSSCVPCRWRGTRESGRRQDIDQGNGSAYRALEFHKRMLLLQVSRWPWNHETNRYSVVSRHVLHNAPTFTTKILPYGVSSDQRINGFDRGLEPLTLPAFLSNLIKLYNDISSLSDFLSLTGKCWPLHEGPNCWLPRLVVHYKTMADHRNAQIQVDKCFNHAADFMRQSYCCSI